VTTEAEPLWERRADVVLGVAASVLLFCLMSITFADVVARYLLNRPIRGAFEITELGLLVLIFAGLPLVSRADEHVTMDFIDRILPRRLAGLWIRVMHALCAALMFFLTWQVWIKAGRISGYGDTTDVLRILIGPFVYFMAVMIAFTGLVHVFKIRWPGNPRLTQGAG
jgi:TRAP-type transport system small permease protein